MTEFGLPPHWQVGSDQALAPNLHASMQAFNKLSRFATAYMLSERSKSKRTARWEQMALTAFHLLEMKCISGAAAICSSFANSAVFRLRRTKENAKPSVIAKLDQVRAAIENCTQVHLAGPCVPHLAQYLTDVRQLFFLGPFVLSRPGCLLRQFSPSMCPDCIRERRECHAYGEGDRSKRDLGRPQQPPPVNRLELHASTCHPESHLGDG